MVVRAEVEVSDLLGILVCKWSTLIVVLDWGHYEVRSDIIRHLSIISLVQFHVCLSLVLLTHLQLKLSN